ncbi:hypothetical protein BDV96DRAFT_504588 [Lophiotrema nucula]|uniref:RBR-type E3 ubiquitin transferase n=1 Tax=Lophiotrema nucula TaxID=690887 RepID=A0A6A5YMT2_9PLEO|nr:hypothetical protein BDV96DRAFT_504588 [Lophiotrema nucula]
MHKQSKCAMCHDYHENRAMISLPCNDYYCINCMKERFMRATKDEGLFPVRCCQKPIPIEVISKHLTLDEMTAIGLSSIEFSTEDRIYCSNPHCHRFQLPARLELGVNRVVCDSCGMSTCTTCKQAYHRGQDCPDDPGTRQVQELAQELGWKTCPSCRRVVILRSGCNHMTCVCKAEFCYECGTRWKNCNCEWGTEHRMLERAEEVVDRDNPFGLPQAERQRRIQQVRADLDDNHDCEHPGRFQRIFNGGRRGFQCEMCDTRHWKYILRCRRCHIDVCEDCRRNRI